ncbi:MAG: hypothetical protein ACSI46_01715 [Gloeotrichia echinulata DVL01]
MSIKDCATTEVVREPSSVIKLMCPSGKLKSKWSGDGKNLSLAGRRWTL